MAGAATNHPFAEPTELSATGTLGDSGVDEWSVAQLVFPGGITASARSGVRLQDANSVTVYGSRGTIRLADPWTLGPEPELVLT